jgi:hypothetical protein
MSLTREHIQEDLSVAYISAVAAKAGYDCQNYGRHDYGIDLQINPIVEINKKRYYEGVPLRIQAKASHDFGYSNSGYISFDLKTRNYNILAKDQKGYPIILVLYCMPRNDNDWLSIYNEGTTLKHCGYWLSLRGKELSNTKYTTNIKIPKDQIFSETSLISLMANVQERGYP